MKIGDFVTVNDVVYCIKSISDETITLEDADGKTIKFSYVCE